MTWVWGKRRRRRGEPGAAAHVGKIYGEERGPQRGGDGRARLKMTLRMGVKSTRGREVDGEEETGTVGEKVKETEMTEGKKRDRWGKRGLFRP